MHLPTLVRVIIVLTAVSTALASPHHIVVRLKAGSPSATTWFANGRAGILPSLAPVVGTHTSAPYLLDATLQCYQGALDRRLAPRREFADTTPRWKLLPLARTVIIACERDARTMARKLSTHPDVEAADPMPVHEILAIPNDTLYPAQWHLPWVRAQEAWDLVPKDATAVVGVVDTGLQFDHEDMSTQVAINRGEDGVDDTGADRRSNGRDDDNNGFVDDWRGWDFVSSTSPTGTDNDPSPGNLHGTHVAGIVAAAVNNTTGVAGTAVQVKVLPVKVGDDDIGARTVSRTADGILYAASMGVDVINCSFGSASQSFADEDVVNAAADLGTLVIGAAGNNGVDGAYYPAAYERALSVASTGTSDRLSFFSNRHRTVDVSAPGQSILSTVPTNGYLRLDGTSMAAPIVAGMAAMVRMLRPTTSAEEVAAIIKATTDNVDTSNTFAVGRMGTGRVNALAAMQRASLKWADVIMATFADGNADGVFTPGEEASVTLRIRNELDTLANARLRVRLVPAPFAPIITDSIEVIGAMGRGEIRDLAAAIRLTLPNDVPFNASLDVLIEIFDGDELVGRNLVATNVNTTYRTLIDNDLAMTVNSTGNIAFNDYPDNAQGDGVTYRGSRNLLFEGALMIGSAAGTMVNVARAADTDRKDTAFHPSEILMIRTDSVPSGIRAVARFSDVYDPWPVGISVRNAVYQSADDSVRNAVTICYDVTNRADTVLPNLHVAMYHDWDIGPSGQDNLCAWDAEHGIGMVRNIRRPELPVVGVSMISPFVTHFFAVDNDGITPFNPGVYDHFLRGEKWFMMSNGVARAQSSITDASMVIGGGPFSLAPGETRQVCFAIAAGADYDDVVEGLQASRARAIGMGLHAVPYERAPTASEIIHVENGPTLRPGTTNITYQLHFITGVAIDIVDLFGRTIADVYDAYEGMIGTHVRSIEIPSVPSGNYFIRLRTAQTTHVAPISILR